MRLQHRDRPLGPALTYTAAQQRCPDCGRPLPIYQNDRRIVQGLDHRLWLNRRDKRCSSSACPGARPLFRAPRDLRVLLPGRIYGFDVTLHVGESHLLDGLSQHQIASHLNDRGIAIHQRTVGRIFRDFLALTALDRTDDEALRMRLQQQGGIVLMCDGVQFEDRSPVLYLTWDAISGQPLFGQRKLYRGEEDLVPLLQGVRDMGVDVIGIVTDKEKGLVPAVKQVFPGVPYQFCHTHFLKNCAKPLQPDITALGKAVARRADEVREIGKAVAKGKVASVASGDASPEAMSESQLVHEMAELVRLNSRVSGKAPLAPAELNRHERLEQIRAVVGEARKKKEDR